MSRALSKKTSNSLAWHLPGATLFVAAIAVGVALLPASWRDACLLRIDGGGMTSVTWITGHMVHVSLSHLVWDVLMFVVLGVMVERAVGSFRFVAFMCVAMLGVALGVRWLCTDLAWYAGLSGIDSALAGFVAAGWLRHRDLRRYCGAVVLGGIMLKSGYEVVTSSTAFADLAPGVVPVPVAHLAGGLIGVLMHGALGEAKQSEVTHCAGQRRLL